MATYLELRNLYQDGDLLNKLDVAICIAAQGLLDGAPTSGEAAWAVSTLRQPRANAETVLKYLLAVNSSVEASAIASASDATIQSSVDAVVPKLVSVFAGV